MHVAGLPQPHLVWAYGACSHCSVGLQFVTVIVAMGIAGVVAVVIWFRSRGRGD